MEMPETISPLFLREVCQNYTLILRCERKRASTRRPKALGRRAKDVW